MAASFLVASLLLALMTSGLAASGDPAQAQTFLENLEAGHLLGGQVAASLDGSIAGVSYIQGFGYANHELGVEWNTSHTTYIGSNTKFMTAVAIFQLHQKGLIDVDAPASKYMVASDFGKPSNWTWCPKVHNSTSTGCQTPTIRHLITMGSGILQLDNCGYLPTDWQFPYCWMNNPCGMTLQYGPYPWIEGVVSVTNLTSLIVDLPLEFLPGTSYGYSNPGFNLASYIIEKVSGMRLGDYYQQYIFDPAGLNDTYYGVGGQVYGVKPGSVLSSGYATLFAPYSGILDYRKYAGSVANPAYAAGVGKLALAIPPHAPAGTYQGVVQPSWFNGETALGAGAGAVVSNTGDMVKWFKTFVATPEKIGLNQTTLTNMFSYHNVVQDNQPLTNGNSTTAIAYFGPGIAVVPGPGGLWNMSQLAYEGGIAGVAFRVHIKLNGAAPINSTVIAIVTNMVPAIPHPNTAANGTTDCMVTDTNVAGSPPEKLPQLLCDITQAPTFIVYVALYLTKLWGF